MSEELGQFVDDLIGREYRSNRALAAKVGVSEATIRRVRQGKSVQIDTLQKLSSGLNVPLSELEYLAGIREQLEGSRADLLSLLENILHRLDDDSIAQLKQFALYLADSMKP